MLETGYIKLHRSILSWEWYGDTVTTCVFLHLLLTANIKDDRWQGIDVPRGSRVCSYTKLAEELKKSKEILLYSYYSGNIEITQFSDGEIKYFDRKGDADFAHKLSTWLMDKTGRTWKLVREMSSAHVQTVSEQKQEELVADPLVASAMSLFENAEIVGVK